MRESDTMGKERFTSESGGGERPGPAFPGCTHLDQIHEVEPGSDGCEECLRMGAEWVHLRLCTFCGHVGCCDNSRYRHARQHHRESGHAIIQSFEPEETWMYCYPDDAFMEPD